MKKYTLIIVLFGCFFSCSTNIFEMKKDEIKEDTGLLILNIEMNSCFFYGVKNNRVIYRIVSPVEDDRFLYSYERVSTPIDSLKKVKIAKNYGTLRYVWVKITYHAKDDFKAVPHRAYDELCGNKSVGLDNKVKIDRIEILDKKKEKVYKQTIDSLFEAKAPSILYGI